MYLLRFNQGGRVRNTNIIQLPLIAIFVCPIVTWLRVTLLPFVPLLRLYANIHDEHKRITTPLYVSEPVPGPFKVAVWSFLDQVT